MNWLHKKFADSDKVRIEHNLQRLKDLKDKVHHLAYFVFSSQSGGYNVLKDLLEDNLVQGRPKVHHKLQEAFIGKNRQKIALDSPGRFQKTVFEAERLIDLEILAETKKLKKLHAED